jgi:hypothetical protein
MTMNLVHVHVMRGKRQELAIFQVIPDVKLLKKGKITPHELKMAELIIEENKEIIIKAWNNFFAENNHENKN